MGFCFIAFIVSEPSFFRVASIEDAKTVFSQSNGNSVSCLKEIFIANMKRIDLYEPFYTLN